MRTPLTALVAFCLFFIPAIAQDSTSCVTAPSGLVSWWQGEGTADDFTDGNDGTLMGGATFADGMVGQAFSFDGMASYVDVPHSDSIFFANDSPFAIEAWFKPESEVASFFILKNAAYGLRWQGSTSPLAFYNGSYHYSTRTSWVLDHWYHVVLVDDGVNSVALYVDGALDRVDDGALWNPNRFPCHGDDYCFALQFGGIYETHDVEYFTGQVDEVSLYNRALTAVEIESIFAAGSAGKCTLPPADCYSDLAACLDDAAFCNSNLDECTSSLTLAQNDLAVCTTDLAACASSLATCEQNLGAAMADLAEAQEGLTEIMRLQALPFGKRTTTFTCSGILCPEIMAAIQQLLNPSGLNYSPGD